MRGFGLQFMWIVVASVGVAMATFSGAVHASGKAGLRILCDGDVENSLVTINGKRMGSCPVDLEVPAGPIHLVISQDLPPPWSRLLERRYETRFEMAPNALRRVVVEQNMLERATKNRDRAILQIACGRGGKWADNAKDAVIFVDGSRVDACQGATTRYLEVAPGERQLRVVKDSGSLEYIFSRSIKVTAGEIAVAIVEMGVPSPKSFTCAACKVMMVDGVKGEPLDRMLVDLKGRFSVIMREASFPQYTSRVLVWESETGLVAAPVSLPQKSRQIMVSADGSVALGWYGDPAQRTQFTSGPSRGLQGLSVDEGRGAFDAIHLTPDGRFALGNVNVYEPRSRTQSAVAVWSADQGLVPLGLPYSFYNRAMVLSPGGSAAAVASQKTVHLWTKNGGRSAIGHPPFNSPFALGGISDGGDFIVGTPVLSQGDPTSPGLYAWTPEKGWHSLGSYPDLKVLGVSGDGKVVVGHFSQSNGYQAFVWTVQTGLMKLSDVLVSAGVKLGTSHLTSANGISPDGTFIVGTANYDRVFVARLDWQAIENAVQRTR